MENTTTGLSSTTSIEVSLSFQTVHEEWDTFVDLRFISKGLSFLSSLVYSLRIAS